MYITSVHGHYSVSRYSAIMAGGDRVIAVSDHIRDYTLHNYPGTDAARVTTVHGGISRQAFPYGHQPPPGWREAACREFPELRRLTRALRPLYLDDLGLVAALDMLARAAFPLQGTRRLH